jgi:flagellar biosynthetic protein FliP
VAAAPAATVPGTAGRIDSLVPRLAPQMELQVGRSGDDTLRLSGTVGIVVMMGLLTLLPMLVLMMTGFTRILVVMHFLRQALGAQSAPPAQLVAGLSLLLTLFVMRPTLDAVNREALTPWMDGRIEQGEMLRRGVQPFRTFMLAQTRDEDIAHYLELSGQEPVADDAAIPLLVLTTAFVTSELRVAFQLGFALFLPFIVIDIVVASVLMSVGMMMVPPAMIALPFKLLLFVLVDGWTLITQSLIAGFN